MEVLFCLPACVCACGGGAVVRGLCLCLVLLTSGACEPVCLEQPAALCLRVTNNKLCVLQWEPDDAFPASCSRGVGEAVLYDNAGPYDNLPSPKIFARSTAADRKASRLPADKLSSNHYKRPASCSPPPAASLTNTSSVGRASGGPHAQVLPPTLC